MQRHKLQTCAREVEYALREDKFKVNDIDNLIFLDKHNHFGSHPEYDAYIIQEIQNRLVGTGIDDIDEKVDILIEFIDEIKEVFKNEYIGKEKKINNITR